MKDSACSRLWEVEAFHEGRLHGSASASLERHVTRCAVCRSDLSEARRMTQALRALPVPPIDEVSARRQRQELLAEVYEAPAQKPRSPAVAFAALAAAVAALLALGAFMWPSSGREIASHRMSSVSRPRESSIVAKAGTRWSRHRTPTLERVELVEGELAVEAHHVDPSEQLIVAVPDGEIEDVGTRFVVNVSDGSTRQIVVSEGSVIFRRNDGVAVRLDAPTTWTGAAKVSSMPHVPATRPGTSAAPKPVATASAVLAEANEARRAGDHGRAIGLHRRLQQSFPSSREAHASCGIMGRLLLDGGDAASALASFDAYRARGHGPLDESVLVGRASALERLGRPDEARAAWGALLEAFPDSPYAEHARIRAGDGLSP